MRPDDLKEIENRLHPRHRPFAAAHQVPPFECRPSRSFTRCAAEAGEPGQVRAEAAAAVELEARLVVLAVDEVEGVALEVVVADDEDDDDRVRRRVASSRNRTCSWSVE